MPGWRSAALEMRHGGTAELQSIGRTAAPAVIGEAVDRLADAGAAGFDDSASVEVRLLHDGMWLAGASDTALLAGANLAVLGDELIQFAAVEALGDNRFRLSGLVRGLHGSEWAMAAHVPGEQFVLLEEAALKPIKLPAAALGSEVECRATGIGDTAGPAIAAITLVGRSWQESMELPPK